MAPRSVNDAPPFNRVLRADSPLSSACVLLSAALAAIPSTVAAQGRSADYERADTLAERTDGLVVGVPEAPHWLSGNRFWHRKTVTGGNTFVLVDIAAASKQSAFDHEQMAAAIGAATRHTYTGVTLPFRTFAFVEEDRAIEFSVDGFVWRCTLASPACTKASVRG